MARSKPSPEYVAALTRLTLREFENAFGIQRMAAISIGNWDHWIARASLWPFDDHGWKETIAVNHAMWHVIVGGLSLDAALAIGVRRRRRRRR